MFSKKRLKIVSDTFTVFPKRVLIQYLQWRDGIDEEGNYFFNENDNAESCFNRFAVIADIEGAELKEFKECLNDLKDSIISFMIIPENYFTI